MRLEYVRIIAPPARVPCKYRGTYPVCPVRTMSQLRASSMRTHFFPRAFFFRFLRMLYFFSRLSTYSHESTHACFTRACRSVMREVRHGSRWRLACHLPSLIEAANVTDTTLLRVYPISRCCRPSLQGQLSTWPCAQNEGFRDTYAQTLAPVA